MQRPQYPDAPGDALLDDEARALEHQVFELAAELLCQGIELRRLARARLEHPEHHYAIPRVTERV